MPIPIDDMNTESLDRLCRLSNEWLDCYQEVNDQLNEKKEVLLTSRRMRLVRKGKMHDGGEANVGGPGASNNHGSNNSVVSGNISINKV